jgi:hypothetical protein
MSRIMRFFSIKEYLYPSLTVILALEGIITVKYYVFMEKGSSLLRSKAQGLSGEYF